MTTTPAAPPATTDRPEAVTHPAAEPVPDRSASSLLTLLAPIRTPLIVAGVVQAFAAVASIVPFVAVALIGGELLGDGPVDDDRVWRLAWFAVAAVVVRTVLVFTAGGITHVADNALQLNLRRRIVDRIGRVPLGWFGERNAGQVKKAVADDVAAMHHLVGHSLTDMVAAVVTPLAAIVYMLTVDWRFTLVVLVPIVLGFVLYSRQMTGYGEKMEQYNQGLAEVNGAAVEFTQGIAVVKTFGRSGRAHQRFLDAANRFVDSFWEWVRGLIRLASASEVVLAPLAGLVWISAAGTVFVARGWLEPVDLLPFYLVGLAVAAPVLALGYSVNDLQLASQAARRVAAMLDLPELTVVDARVAVPTTDDGLDVVYEGVRFSYDGEHEVLSGIDLHLTPGTVTALVGPSGSGKSTIAKLLCRFWDPTAGRVALGGVDLRQIPSEQLYRRVGFVFQDVQLLRASVRDNIALGRPSATDAEVVAAARAAQIHDRIGELPDRYDSVVGVDARFSGGEAQRVSIARALLADTPIVVLDEATAFADPESEAAIQDALAELVAGRTLLVIAHRLHTIVHADQIVVVDGGRIVEQGRHDDLVTNGGLYSRLWSAHERAGGEAAS